MTLSRRSMMCGTVSGFFAFALRHCVSQALAAAPMGRAKRCVVLWMDGGPSQLDTFDPKPGTSTGGEFQSISTSIPGIAICETLPKIAQHMDKLAIVRSLTSNEGDHLRGQYYLHTGFAQVPGLQRPALGAVVSHEAPTSDMPNYVALGAPSFGPAHMGLEHTPFAIADPAAAREQIQRLRRRRGRLALIDELDREFNRQRVSPAAARRSALVRRIERLADTPFARALDVDREPLATRQRYGDDDFGQSCLLARRLLEAGVAFIEIQQSGWDTHSDNFTAVRQLCEQIDGPWSALLDDLATSGMLSETLLIWMGEFGRTPTINSSAGRDHFPLITPVVLAGGGIRSGTVVGRTNSLGTAIDGDSHSVADLFATIFNVLGIDPQREFTNSFGAPTPITDGGQVIAEL